MGRARKLNLGFKVSEQHGLSYGHFESFIFKCQMATIFHYYSVLPGFAEDNHIFLGHKTIVQSSLLASVYLSWADKSSLSQSGWEPLP